MDSSLGSAGCRESALPSLSLLSRVTARESVEKRGRLPGIVPRVLVSFRPRKYCNLGNMRIIFWALGRRSTVT